MRRAESGGDGLECVIEFCYLGDMLSAGGGAESSSVCRVRGAWNKFRELTPMLTTRDMSLKAKGILYESCMRSVMMYGIETWAAKKEDIRRVERADLSVIRWICSKSLRKEGFSRAKRTS